MKVYAYADISGKRFNGAVLILKHHLHALERLLGATGGIIGLDEDVPRDADWIMFQSEWWVRLRDKLQASDAQRICWLGHFINNYGMPDIASIDADVFHSQYKGECTVWAESVLGKKVHYLPHAGCHCMKEGKKIDAPEVVFIGSNFPERTMDWLPVSPMTAENPSDYYKSSLVCPNIHGDWQKGKVTDYQRLRGEMINDRMFNVILSGGFAVSDNTPIVKDFFSGDEVPYGETKEEYRALIDFFRKNPKEREPYMERAKEKVRKKHLYTHRWKNLLSALERVSKAKTA